MKCFPRSIRSFASSVLWLLLWSAPLYGGASAPIGNGAAETELSSPDAITRAIEKAVHAHIGTTATVSVSNLSGVRLARATSAFVALPDPSARIGVPVRFVL